MIITLKNEQFTVCLNTLGAEINDFKDKDGTAYVWNGDAAIWKYHAPIIFPHVGRIKDGYIYIEGQKCLFPANGFSRDMEHALVSSSDTEALFELVANEETLKNFPYHFTLQTYYKLTEKGLIFKTTVKNTDSKEISFSIGSHTAFTCPRNPSEESISDYQVEFENKEALTTVKMTEGFLAIDEDGTAPCTELYGEAEQGIIPLTTEGFGRGHFFTQFTSSWVGLRNKKDNSLIKVNAKDYPYLMVWQNMVGEPSFVCIEPWYGTPDPENADNLWENKASLVYLQPGETFTTDQSFEIEK